jgi:hypothetical protein
MHLLILKDSLHKLTLTHLEIAPDGKTKGKEKVLKGFDSNLRWKPMRFDWE